jgi:predicted MPP superfamily phosphohydrolase
MRQSLAGSSHADMDFYFDGRVIQAVGGTFNLIGIDYQRCVTDGTTMPTLNGAESLVHHDMPNILLSHNPNTFYSAAAVGVELSLPGQTYVD